MNFVTQMCDAVATRQRLHRDHHRWLGAAFLHIRAVVLDQLFAALAGIDAAAVEHHGSVQTVAAAKNGAPYVIINRGDTDHDRLATLRLEGDVADLLPPAIRALT